MNPGNEFRHKVMGDAVGPAEPGGPDGPADYRPAVDAEFRVGGVLGQGFRVLFGNLLPFMIVALLFQWPGELGGYLIESGTQAVGGPSPDRILAGFAIALLSGVLSYLVTAALVYGTTQHLRGRRVGVGECLSRGLGRVLPVVGVAIVTGILVMFGVIALIVPGVIVALMLWVAIPAAVVERSGVFESLARSARLTKGYRWKILGIVMIGILVAAVVGGLVGVVGGVFDLFVVSHLPVRIANWVAQAFGAALVAVLSAVSYHHLRVAKEGAAIDDIAAVFD